MLGRCSMTPAEIVAAATELGVTVSCAESLTAGLICSAFADIPGSGEVLRGGVVSYATDAKASVLGVNDDLLELVGPVDPATALAMAERVRTMFDSTLGLSATGVAGPTGQDGHDPGEVYVALSDGQAKIVQRLALEGERNEIRAQSVKAALGLVEEYLAGRGR